MTPEQKEVLRRYLDGSCYWSSDIDDNRQFFDEDWRDADRQILNDFLSEHPADDDEPVTEEWFQRVGADVEIRSEEWVAVFDQTWEDRAALFIYSDGTVLATNMGHIARLKTIKTRGDVRILCRVFRIPLTE